MNKRIRKKLHEKEFTEYGIKTVFSCTVNLTTTSDFSKLVDSIVLDFVEGNGMYCGGMFSMKDITTFEGEVIIELVGKWKGKFIEVQNLITEWMSANFKGIKMDFSPINLWFPDRKVTNEDIKRPTINNRG